MKTPLFEFGDEMISPYGNMRLLLGISKFDIFLVFLKFDRITLRYIPFFILIDLFAD
jgi:hypothetical protein